MPDPLMKLHSPFGDKLKFSSMVAGEELGRLYDFNVIALAAPRDKLEPKPMLGKNAAVSIELPGGSRRHFHGLIAAASLDGATGNMVRYRLRLRPWLWLLTRRADSRIFQNKTVVDILRKVFQNYTGDVQYDLQGTYPKYEYCVQYRETDFNFVSRLMESEGIYYYFKHTADKHTLVLCDKMSAHTSYPGHVKLKFRESQDQLIDHQAIGDWRHAFEIPPGKVVLDDYDYLAPSKDLHSSVDSVHPTPPATALDIYDQPGEYQQKGEGLRYAQLRMEELDARYQRVSGSSPSVRGLAAGYLFTLEEHPVAAENAQYLVVSTHIDMRYAGYESGQEDHHFECRFGAIPHADTYRSERSTPKPIVPGPQTAVVVGAAGEEIYTDEHGRVKVQFHWDREGKLDQDSSCWLRVASGLAGKGWGMIALPRIGQEVVVDFLEGDPDRPLITSRVYNASQVPPYQLPDRKTVSTMKTRSSKGGGAANYNELLFDDAIGHELVRLHAEKDLVEIAKNDAHLQIGHDQFRQVGNDLTEEIGHDMQATVGNDRFESVGANHGLTVARDCMTTVGDKYGLAVGADMAVDAGGSLSINAGSSGDLKFGSNLGVAAGANVHIKGGANVVIEAGAMLTLKGAMINIEASGILSLNGSLTKINSGGGGGGGSGANPKKPTKPKKPDPPKKLKDFIKSVADQLANR